MVELGLTKSSKPVSVSFRIPYYTQWGQSLVVCGSEPVLGTWNVKRSLQLSPVHEGDELVWFGSCEYNYYVVDDDRNLLLWEMGNKRRILLPQNVQEGEPIHFHDFWQVGADALPFRSAFKDVIFRRDWTLEIEKPLEVIQNSLQSDDSVLVHFKICCPNIEEGTSIYVIGSTSKLGNWKAQGGLKLSYSGESTWHADCVLPKGDFPIKYPF